jgi:hypothetical protein
MRQQVVSVRTRRVVRRLERNLSFVLFYLLPELEEFQYSLPWLAGRTGLREPQCREWADDLLAAGLWELSAAGGALKVKLARRQLDIPALPSAESAFSVFMSLTAQIQSRVAADSDRACYDVKVQSTTPEAFLRFKKKVLQAQDEFLEESERAPASTLVSYSLLFDESRTREICQEAP